jgi:hypothetical protein
LVACGARTPLDLGAGAADASTPGIDASVDSALPPKMLIHVGYVGAIRTVEPSPDGAFFVARFYPELVDPACGYLGATGTCAVVDCFSASATSDDAGLINANVISGGDSTFLPYEGVSPTGTYPTATFAAASDSDPGTAIDFSGLGAIDVPPFDVEVTMPDAATLVSPVISTSTILDTSADLTLTWSPVAEGDAIFGLAPSNSTGTTPTLLCFFDGATGSAVVPRADLAQIKAASPRGEAQVSFFAMSRASTTAGDWTVSALAVGGDATTEQSGTVTLE